MLEKQIPHINTYIWELEKEYRWTYLQGRNGDRHGKWTSGHSGGRRGWDELRRFDIYTLSCVQQIESWNLLYNTRSLV